MSATEKYIEKDTGFIVEIEQEDNQKWVWIYRSKADFEIGKLYRGGNIIKETETSYKYRYFIQKGSKIKTLTKDNLLGFLKKDDMPVAKYWWRKSLFFYIVGYNDCFGKERIVFKIPSFTVNAREIVEKKVLEYNSIN